MKKIILLALIMLVSAKIANADWYVFNIENKFSGVYKNEPNSEWLERHNLIAVYTDEDIPWNEAEYRNGKVVKHHKTQKELKSKQENQALIEATKAKLIELGFAEEMIDLLLAPRSTFSACDNCNL